MAISDSNLLNLLLAYSASHRARYLKQPEPANRVAHWVRDVFPTLRRALEDPPDRITDSHVAAAIMLLSLKIISPGTFEVPITWQSHLKLARRLFLGRGLGAPRKDAAENKIRVFLSRWLAYLAILGSLSCRDVEPPMIETAYHSLVDDSLPASGFDYYHHVDCLTGFSPRTGLFLLQLAILVHQCDNQRFDKNGDLVLDWRPSPQTIVDAEAMLSEFESIRSRAHADGPHYCDRESQEMIAIQDAFLYSGLVHLYRRVFGYPTQSIHVQDAHRKLMDALNRTRRESSTEVSCLFPLFTAGCESQDPQQRREIMERVLFLERMGMKQVRLIRHMRYLRHNLGLTLTRSKMLAS